MVSNSRGSGLVGCGSGFGKRRSAGKDLSIEDVAEKSMNISLRDDHLQQIAKHKMNICSYRGHVAHAQCLDDFLAPHGAAIILYESKPKYGHWVAVFRGPQPRTLNYFDSYGRVPDFPLQKMSPQMRCQPMLAALCAREGVKLIYSPYKLQKDDDNTSSCGRWAALRVALRSLDADTFGRMFLNPRNHLKPDAYVNLMTMFASYFT